MTKLDRELDELAEIARPIVARIEAAVPTTMNHWGDYMVAISRLAEKLPLGEQTPALFLAIGVAFQRAGASRHGVQWALRNLGYL